MLTNMINHLLIYRQLYRAVLAVWFSVTLAVTAASPESKSEKQVSAGVSSAIAEFTPRVKSAPRIVRLGISVERPGDSLYAQLPKLQRGSGFLLKAISAGSSAKLAGLKPMDIITKLDDQLLINENQLMTLLSMRRPGDQVSVTYLRSGMENVATLKLQKAKIALPPSRSVAASPNLPSIQAGLSAERQPSQSEQAWVFPMRTINYENRSASISDTKGTATLMVREGKPWLRVESPKGFEEYNGPVTAADDIANVPLVWRDRLPILQRSLEESVRLRRVPRIRYVPKQKHQFAGGQ